MDLMKLYLSCALFVNIFAVEGELSRNQPNLATNGNDDKFIEFQCTVENYDNDLKIHFHKNALSSRNESVNIEKRIFENCINLTNIASVSCKETSKNSKFIITYKFDRTNLPSGTYYCTYLDHHSSSYNHVQSIKDPESTFQASITTMANRVVEPRKSEPPMKVEIIFGIIGIFVLSIVVNLIFIIRCCLIRSYLSSKYRHANNRIKMPVSWSWLTCFCLKEEIQATDIYYKTRDDPYEKIRDHLGSDASKSKSSIVNEYVNRPISQDTEKLCFSSSASQISRSSTFPARQSIIVHTPTDQFSLSALPASTIDYFQPYLVQYKMDPQTKTMVPVMNTNHRLSSHCIYDEVPGEHIAMNPSSTMPIRHFSSTGSLNNRSRQSINNIKVIPLPEESQISFSKIAKDPSIHDEDMGLVMNDCSSVLQDFSSSEETYLSGKDSDSLKDPVRVAKLEMSREMMAKADTLLREAHNLLKMT